MKLEKGSLVLEYLRQTGRTEEFILYVDETARECLDWAAANFQEPTPWDDWQTMAEEAFTRAESLAWIDEERMRSGYTEEGVLLLLELRITEVARDIAGAIGGGMRGRATEV